MYNELIYIILPPNVFINNVIINKERFTGTLTQGIYANIQYAIEHFIFKYFIVLSSRTLFYNNLSIDILNKKQKKIEIIDNIQTKIEIETPIKDYTVWWWPKFCNISLYMYQLFRYMNNDKIIYNENLLISNILVQNEYSIFWKYDYVNNKWLKTT